MKRRQPWTGAELDKLRSLYPTTLTRAIATQLKRPLCSIFGAANKLGLKKDPAFVLATNQQLGRQLVIAGAAYRFPKGHIPFQKGLKGWQAGGRSVETQFKKGHFPINQDPDFYVIGALRVNFYGYVDMRVSFAPGARGWRGLHQILWEDANGPVPPHHCLRFRDNDPLNVCLENLELISRAEHCRRNSIHNLPPPLRQTINALGALKRTIKRRNRDAEENRRSA